ncbi:unnamed protein product [Cylicocyclus nassatus]|uniref:BTB domain-containing protein n=1 Tax=Cylicocyclus nassatus TaxID=53992 RepID=A0AA36M4T8_CYLNA|nr:unnamed protein product [Cylicocyclus nassatus]
MSNLNRRVKLNVGGQIFETTVGTLTRVNGSLLAKLVENISENDDESIFIDHDPRYFSSVLNFLRDGRIPLPDDIKEIDELRREAQYFNLKSMTDFIDCEEQRGPPFFRGDKVVWKDHNFHRALSKCGWHFDGTTEDSKEPLCFIPRTISDVEVGHHFLRDLESHDDKENYYTWNKEVYITKIVTDIHDNLQGKEVKAIYSNSEE